MTDEERFQQLEKNLETHMNECNLKFNDLDLRISNLLTSQERCTNAVEKLSEETGDIVQLYRDAKGAVVVGTGIQKFGVWMLKWGAIGAGAYTCYMWLISHLPK